MTMVTYFIGTYTTNAPFAGVLTSIHMLYMHLALKNTRSKNHQGAGQKETKMFWHRCQFFSFLHEKWRQFSK